MILDYVGVKEINGSLIVLDGVKDASFEEMVDIRLDDGSSRHGRIVQIDGERIVVQVFEGTKSISLDNTRTHLKARPMELALSPEIMGRVFKSQYQRHPYESRFENIPQKLHKYRYFYHRYPDDAYSRSEAADFLRLRYEA